MKPTLGRVVLYRNGYGNIYPAIINAVRGDGRVRLWVFEPISPYQTDYVAMAGSSKEAQASQWWWPERV